jgi:RHS repeat-associated protein
LKSCTVSFKYDPFGRRIYKSSGSGMSIYAYDDKNLIEEANSTGAVVARYAQTGNIDEPLAMLRSSTTSYYQTDGLGSVTSLSTGAGALANTYAYDSFGKTTPAGSIVNSFQYTGREFDAETNLYFYRARYYNPSLQRFISEDPTEFDSGDTNLYAYVGNNPLSWIDPFGTDKKTNGCGWKIDPNATPYEQPNPSKHKGFTQSSFSAGAFGGVYTFSITIDDFGNAYVAPLGLGVGTPGIGGAVTRGGLDINFPSEQDLVTNISGNNISLCGGSVVVGCRSYTPGAKPWNNTAGQLGLGTKGASLTWSYAWKLPWKLWKPCE